MRAITRHFAKVGDRLVHYAQSGQGPVVALLHESPRSWVALLPLVERLAARFTVLAFDTPGYGNSDALSAPAPDTADFADAQATTLRTLGLGPVPVYGTHTGAGIAAEMAARHPDQVAIAVLDGLPFFSRAEKDDALAHYLPPFRPLWDGSHMAWLWSRVRDQYSFFPWYLRGSSARLPRDPPPLEQHHRVVLDVLRAGDNYRIAYAAAFAQDTVATVRAARAPTTLVCRSDDLLFPHLDRAPDGQDIVRLGADRDAWAAMIGDIMARSVKYAGPVSGEQPKQRRFVDGIQVRCLGTGPGRPALLLHRQPGSGRTLLPLAHRLAEDRPVVLVDLPGSGESSALPAGAIAPALTRLIHELEIREFDLAGEYTGGTIAAAVAKLVGQRLHRLAVIDRPDGPSDAYHVDVTPRWDGAHMMTAWHRQRDALLYHPWFDRRTATAIPLDAALKIDEVQTAATATLQGAETEPEICRALLRMPVDWSRIPSLSPAPPRMLANALRQVFDA